MEDEDFLAALEEANNEPQVDETAGEPKAEQPEAQPEVEAKEPARDETGKFTKKEEPAPEPVKDTHTVPLPTFLEVRDKVKHLESELEQFRRATQPQPQPAPIPDPLDDPEGFAHYQRQAIEQASLNTTLNISEEMARQAHGDDLVSAAQQWAQSQFASNPSLYAEFTRQRNPYGYIVKEYQRQQMLSQVGDDPKDIEAFLAWKQAQTAVSQQQAAPPAAPPTPPRSLASAPSAGGGFTEPLKSDDEVFQEVFPE